jgi:hypothetical protein
MLDNQRDKAVLGRVRPTTHVGRSTLRGSYRGASGNVALGVGLGVNVLIGGFRRTISPQPVSVDGQIGINLALGVTSLSIASTARVHVS